MSDGRGARRSPARFLVPVALVAVMAGTYLIVEHGLHAKHHTTNSPHASSPLTRSQRKFSRQKFYRVQLGDSLTKIADRTGVAVGILQALNPNIDPNSLQPGQRLRLRR